MKKHQTKLETRVISWEKTGQDEDPRHHFEGFFSIAFITCILRLSEGQTDTSKVLVDGQEEPLQRVLDVLLGITISVENLRKQWQEDPTNDSVITDLQKEINLAREYFDLLAHLDDFNAEKQLLGTLLQQLAQAKI